MIDYPTIIFAALLIFCYGLISRVSERSPISAPMVFAGIGILAGPLALDLFEVNLNATWHMMIVRVAERMFSTGSMRAGRAYIVSQLPCTPIRGPKARSFTALSVRNHSSVP